MSSKPSIAVAFSRVEMEVLETIAQSKGVGKAAIMREAFKVYQIVHRHIDRGEELRFEPGSAKEALERINEWAMAYPVSAFPEPDLKKARALLEAGGMSLDAISASAMRHVIQQVAKIATGTED